MLASIQNLWEISSLCRTGEHLPPELSHWLGETLHEYLNRRAPSLEDAMGLKYPRGGVPWWAEVAIVKRDMALREMGESCSAESSQAAKTRLIRTLSVRYAATAWLRDREKEDMPEHYRGKPKEYLWRAFKSGATMPLTDRHLRTILACGEHSVLHRRVAQLDSPDTPRSDVGVILVPPIATIPTRTSGA